VQKEGKMKKRIKFLSTIMIIIFMLFSALPAFAEETLVSENESAQSENTIEDTGTSNLLTDSEIVEEAANSENTSGSAISENTSGSAISENTSGSDIGENTSGSAIECDIDYEDISMPKSVSIVIDPYDLKGRGQIYSDLYKCENLGETDVRITFNELKVTFANGKDFKALAKPFDPGSGTDLKAVYLVMNFGREDVRPVVLTDSKRKGNISITMSAINAETKDNSFSLSFSGNVNENPAEPWCNGDIKIYIKYCIEPIPKSDEESAGKAVPGTTPAGAVFEMDPAESADEASGEETVVGTTPAGAAFEVEPAESDSTESADEVSGDETVIGTTPAGAVFEADPAEPASSEASHEAASGDMAAVGITTAGAIFEVSLSGPATQKTDSFNEASESMSALEVIQSTTIVEFSQSGSALAGFETVTGSLCL
jgi:hypothetical protein